MIYIYFLRYTFENFCCQYNTTTHLHFPLAGEEIFYYPSSHSRVMEIEVPNISNISVSEEKVINSSLQTKHISDNVSEGKVCETVPQTGDSYDVKSCSSQSEDAQFGIEKLEDVDVHISTSDACNGNSLSVKFTLQQSSKEKQQR